MSGLGFNRAADQGGVSGPRAWRRSQLLGVVRGERPGRRDHRQGGEEHQARQGERNAVGEEEARSGGRGCGHDPVEG